MTRLQRYIWRQAATAFLAGAGALIAIIWVTQALRQIDVLTAKGQTLWIFLGLTGFALPALMVVIMPIALFGATLFVLSRLNGDSELVAMTTSGLSPVSLLTPFLALATLVWLGTSYLTLVVMPESFAALEAMATHLHADLIGNLVRPGAFVELESGFVFHIRERSADGALHGLFIQDRRDPSNVTAYFAETGRTVEKGGRNYLSLSRGMTERLQQDGESAFVSFDQDALDLTSLTHVSEEAKRPRERSTLELLRTDYADPNNKKQEGRLRAELAERFTSPLYSFVAALIGFVALGRPRTSRQGRTTAMTAAAGAFGILRMIGVGMINLAANAPIGATLAYLLPLGAIVVCLALALGPPRFLRLPRLGLAGA